MAHDPLAWDRDFSLVDLGSKPKSTKQKYREQKKKLDRTLENQRYKGKLKRLQKAERDLQIAQIREGIYKTKRVGELVGSGIKKLLKKGRDLK